MTTVLEKTAKGNGPFDVARKITLASTPIEKLQEVIRQLKAIDSIIDAKACQQNKLHIAYDNSRIGIHDIETVLDTAGVVRASGYWCHLKSMWYGYLDENAKSNAHSGGGACCNRPPSAFARRSKHN